MRKKAKKDLLKCFITYSVDFLTPDIVNVIEISTLRVLTSIFFFSHMILSSHTCKAISVYEFCLENYKISFSLLSTYKLHEKNPFGKFDMKKANFC